MTPGYPDDWDSRRRKVYKRDGYACQNCGARGGSNGNTELHAHHIVPKSKGGTHKKQNLITVCRDCHAAIHGNGTAPTPIGRGGFSDRVEQAIERYYRTDEYDDGYVRLGKNPKEDEKSRTQRKVDAERNERYGGCPRCTEYSLTVSWVGIKPGSKAKILECESCQAKYDEQVKKINGDVQRTLQEIDDISDLDTVSSAILKELKNQFRLTFNI